MVRFGILFLLYGPEKFPGLSRNGSLVQHQKSAIHALPVKSSKSDWLRTRDEYSGHTQKIGSSQSSRSLPQIRRVVGSKDENDLQGKQF